MPKISHSFTEAQFAAMQASQYTLEALRSLTPETAPAGFSHVYFSMPGQPHRADVQHYNGVPRTEILANTWKSFRRGAYESYAPLPVRFAGAITVPQPHAQDEPHSEEVHRVLEIDLPDSVLHGLGVIVTCTEAAKQRKTPIERLLGLLPVVNTVTIVPPRVLDESDAQKLAHELIYAGAHGAWPDAT